MSHIFALQKFAEPCKTYEYVMPILPPECWSVSSLLLGESEIMYLSESPNLLVLSHISIGLPRLQARGFR
jgi:hypothetical protein